MEAEKNLPQYMTQLQSFQTSPPRSELTQSYWTVLIVQLSEWSSYYTQKGCKVSTHRTHRVQAREEWVFEIEDATAK